MTQNPISIPEFESQDKPRFRIHVFTGAKDEIPDPCDLLITREDAVIPVPARNLASEQKPFQSIGSVGINENMTAKSAILISMAVQNLDPENSVATLSCADPDICNALCSLEYPAKNHAMTLTQDKITSKPEPETQDPEKPMKRRTRTARKTYSKNKNGDPIVMSTSEPVPINRPVKTPEAPRDNIPQVSDLPDMPESPAPDENTDNNLMADPDLVTGNEMNLTQNNPEPETKKSEPPASQVMRTLKQMPIPAGNIAACLDAIRESETPDQLPEKLREYLKEGDPDEIAKNIIPEFTSLKYLMAKAAAK